MGSNDKGGWGGVSGVGILYQSPKLGVMINGGRKKKLDIKSKFRPRLHELKKISTIVDFFYGNVENVFPKS